MMGLQLLEMIELYQQGCFLPLTNNDKLNKQLGTRHRAAIGVTEITDYLQL